MKSPNTGEMTAGQQYQGYYTTMESPSSEESALPREIPVNLDEEHITDEDREKVQELLKKWDKVFVFSSTELGKVEGIKHSIHLTDNVPFKDNPRRIPPGMYDEVKQHLQDMVAYGTIRPSNSPYSSGVVLFCKKAENLKTLPRF